MRTETETELARAAQSDKLLYDTATLIDTERARKVLACEDTTLRGKRAEEFAHWLRQRGVLPQAGEYAPHPTRPREQRSLYRLADLCTILDQLPALRAQYESFAKRRAAAKAAHPRAATVKAVQTRQTTERTIAGFDAEALVLLERLRALGYPRAAAVRAIQRTPRKHLLQLVERVEAGVQDGSMYRPAAYLAAALEGNGP